MFEHSTERINKSKFNKSPQFFLSQRLRKHYYNTLGTSVIKSSLSPHCRQKNTPHPPLLSIYFGGRGGFITLCKIPFLMNQIYNIFLFLFSHPQFVTILLPLSNRELSWLIVFLFYKS